MKFKHFLFIGFTTSPYLGELAICNCSRFQ